MVCPNTPSIGAARLPRVCHRPVDWPFKYLYGPASWRSDSFGRGHPKMKITPSSGNVFRDLGFSWEEAEHLKVRAVLMLHVQEIVRSRRLRQAQAAKILGVTQPRVSDLLRGRIDLFSTDTLIDMLTRLGGQVKLVVKTPSKKLRVA